MNIRKERKYSGRSLVHAALAAAGIVLAAPASSHESGQNQGGAEALYLAQPGNPVVFSVTTQTRTLGGGDPGSVETRHSELARLESGSLPGSQTEGVFLHALLAVHNNSASPTTFWQDPASGSILEVTDGEGRRYQSSGGGPGGPGLPLVPAYLRAGESAFFEYSLSFGASGYPHARGTRIITRHPAEALSLDFGEVQAHRFTLVDNRQVAGVNERAEVTVWFSPTHGLLAKESSVLAEDGNRRVVTTLEARLDPAVSSLAGTD